MVNSSSLYRDFHDKPGTISFFSLNNPGKKNYQRYEFSLEIIVAFLNSPQNPINYFS